MIKLIAARQALIESFAFGWASPDTTAGELGAIIQCSSKGNLAKIIDGTLCSVIVGTVEKQTPVEQAWLKLAYGDWDQTTHPGLSYMTSVHTWLQDWFWQRYLMTASEQKLKNSRRVLLLLKMIEPALTDGLNRVKTSDRALYARDVQRMVGATRSEVKNWGRDFEPHFQTMLTMLDRLDAHALAPIATMVSVINEEIGEELRCAS